MAKNDFQYGGWNSYTLQCRRWLWDDVPLNSPKRLCLVPLQAYNNLGRPGSTNVTDDAKN